MSFTIDRQQIERYGNLELLAKQVVEGFITGLHKSPFHGFSVEFAEHRLYNNGESVKHIDWKLFGRTDKLFVKRFEEETNLRCQIILDTSSSMFYPPLKEYSLKKQNKISFSIIAAAAIINILKKQRDAIGLTCFDTQITEHTETKSNSAHISHLYQILSQQINNNSGENKETNAAAILHQLAATLHKRSLIILFSDIFENMLEMDDFFDSLRHLKHNKHEIIIFHTHDKETELHFNFNSQPKRFIDLETGEVIKLQANEIKEAYQATMNRFENQLKLKCTQYSIDLVSADIQKGFNQILFPFLSKRKKMY
ncbi:DUF58 domain-containing protein [Lentimicrobium sp. L6]|uniref:DUF58 domain-containing protein n=1 Tax=Lentimicrobium sp. L6 TaxID=2735916 RepID=UPI00155350E2|nr:DUF58 domain-containing protein [Lentimicrobium sp. L6]NPD85411.1 DUF58 domain-containing protein [Lentimicrobium sp. L6]